MSTNSLPSTTIGDEYVRVSNSSQLIRDWKFSTKSGRSRKIELYLSSNQQLEAFILEPVPALQQPNVIDKIAQEAIKGNIPRESDYYSLMRESFHLFWSDGETPPSLYLYLPSQVAGSRNAIQEKILSTRRLFDAALALSQESCAAEKQTKIQKKLEKAYSEFVQAISLSKRKYSFDLPYAELLSLCEHIRQSSLNSEKLYPLEKLYSIYEELGSLFQEKQLIEFKAKIIDPLREITEHLLMLSNKHLKKIKKRENQQENIGEVKKAQSLGDFRIHQAEKFIGLAFNLLPQDIEERRLQVFSLLTALARVFFF